MGRQPHPDRLFFFEEKQIGRTGQGEPMCNFRPSENRASQRPVYIGGDSPCARGARLPPEKSFPLRGSSVAERKKAQRSGGHSPGEDAKGSQTCPFLGVAARRGTPPKPKAAEAFQRNAEGKEKSQNLRPAD